MSASRRPLHELDLLRLRAVTEPQMRPSGDAVAYVRTNIDESWNYRSQLVLVDALVGVAAFFGALMNWNFMLAGSASSNPVLFLVAVLLILAWKVAGYYGLDRFLLPMLGTPWRPGKAFRPAPSGA